MNPAATVRLSTAREVSAWLEAQTWKYWALVGEIYGAPQDAGAGLEALQQHLLRCSQILSERTVVMACDVANAVNGTDPAVEADPRWAGAPAAGRMRGELSGMLSRQSEDRAETLAEDFFMIVYGVKVFLEQSLDIILEVAGDELDDDGPRPDALRLKSLDVQGRLPALWQHWSAVITGSNPGVGQP